MHVIKGVMSVFVMKAAGIWFCCYFYWLEAYLDNPFISCIYAINVLSYLAFQYLVSDLVWQRHVVFPCLHDDLTGRMWLHSSSRKVGDCRKMFPSLLLVKCLPDPLTHMLIFCFNVVPKRHLEGAQQKGTQCTWDILFFESEDVIHLSAECRQRTNDRNESGIYWQFIWHGFFTLNHNSHICVYVCTLVRECKLRCQPPSSVTDWCGLGILRLGIQ